jgi:autophagy-related protein 16
LQPVDQQSVQEQLRLRQALGQVEREKAVLQGEKEALIRKAGGRTLESNELLDARVKEVEDRCHALQTQLTEAYKKNSDNVEKMLAAVSGQREAETRATERENEAAKLREKTAELTAAVERARRELSEREMSLTTMRDEVLAVQARLVEKEKTLKEVEEENAALLERWINYKNEEVERLNQQNALLKEQKAAQQSKASVELMGQAKAVMDNKVKTSMLDGASAAGGGEGFVNVKLPSMARKDYVGHQGEANCVAYSPSGAKFCTGGADMRIKIWDARSGSLLSQLSGSVGSVMSARWSPNEAFILGCACDNIARVWDLGVGRLKHTFTGHIGKVYGGVFTADASKVVTGAHDRTVKVWDMNSGNTLRTIFCFSSCNDVCLSDSYSSIASAHLDGALRLWDLRAGEATQELKDAHAKQVTSVCTASNEYALLSSARDNVLKIWDLRKNACVMTLQDDAYRSGLNWSRACWSPDCKFVAAGGAEGSLFIWNVESGALVKQLGSESNATISAVAWNPNGLQLSSTDRKSRIVLWE